jgi:hypothetical protein
MPTLIIYTRTNYLFSARTWWGVVEPNYGMIMCGELTYVALNKRFEKIKEESSQ